MTARSFAPAGNRRHRPDPGHQTRETVRANGHNDWDTICDHWQNIAALANTEINLPSLASHVGDARGGTSSMTDIDEHRNAHLQRTAAIGWLAERDQLNAALTRLAQRAHIVDPPPKKTKKVEPENCVKCGQEIDEKAADGKVTRVDGHPLHANTCYYQAYRDARKAGVLFGTHVHQLANGIKP